MMPPFHANIGKRLAKSKESFPAVSFITKSGRRVDQMT